MQDRQYRVQVLNPRLRYRPTDRQLQCAVLSRPSTLNIHLHFASDRNPQLGFKRTPCLPNDPEPFPPPLRYYYEPLQRSQPCDIAPERLRPGIPLIHLHPLHSPTLLLRKPANPPRERTACEPQRIQAKEQQVRLRSQLATGACHT